MSVSTHVPAFIALGSWTSIFCWTGHCIVLTFSCWAWTSQYTLVHYVICVESCLSFARFASLFGAVCICLEFYPDKARLPPYHIKYVSPAPPLYVKFLDLCVFCTFPGPFAERVSRMLLVIWNRIFQHMDFCRVVEHHRAPCQSLWELALTLYLILSVHPTCLEGVAM